MSVMVSERSEAGSQDERQGALLQLLRYLKDQGYAFVTPTPATHARVLARSPGRTAASLRDAFGWSLPFEPGLLPASLLAMLDTAGLVEAHGDGLRASVRASSLHGDLYLHSAFPTQAKDAVFFGPDSYRFADLIATELTAAPLRQEAHVVDIGTGSGVGAVVAARSAARSGRTARLTMTDINLMALRMAAINIAAAGLKAHGLLAADLADVADPIDLALANPPYMMDDDGRDYRDGGAMHGGAVSLDMARMALARLAPAGRLILYTGSAIVDGRDALHQALAALAAATGFTLRYREIDPDVFGEDLERQAYRDVERIAVVAAVFERTAS